ncbi:MAG: hypothetical protein IPO13_00250 [Rhodocyclaceae bacterium]|nr:hypothetical protein [Rhodocyclaceae bacterium]
MNIAPRPFFTSAALFNFAIALPLMSATPWMGEVLNLQLNPSGQMFLRLIAAVAIAFGWAYWMIGVDPVRYRPYLVLGGVLKVVLGCFFYGAWLTGIIGWQLPVLVTGDFVYAGLFLQYYRQSAGSLSANAVAHDDRR